ncbi:MAG: hypothetical protein HY720_25975 [Planctomycetes bacterium]|nr:hypothetical protein [Planctomycetota bacterium]
MPQIESTPSRAWTGLSRWAAGAALLVVAGIIAGGKCDPIPKQSAPPTPAPAPETGQRGPLRVGVAAVTITPTAFESWTDANGNGEFDQGENFLDAGADRLFDSEEPGALGPDGRPGVAGADDDGNGALDDVGEYLAAGSDDVRDPARDNFDFRTNPGGTEGDGVFQSLAIAGFQGIYGGVMRAATGIRDDLWSRTILAERDGKFLVIQSNDLVGMLHIDINPVKRRVERELGIPFRSIVIASTHDHEGPDPMILWGGHIDEVYMAWLRERMFRSIQLAAASRVEVRMKSVTAYPFMGYDPNTLELKTQRNVRDPSFEGDFQLRPALFDRPFLQHDGRDPYVRYTPAVALQFTAASNGRTVATFVNWHDHPELQSDRNTLLSSDFPHHLRERMERALGGTCVYASGVLGGQIGLPGGKLFPLYDGAGNAVYETGVFDPNGNPFPKLVTRSVQDKIRSVGYYVADACLAALAREPWQTDPVLSVDTQDLDIDLVNLPFQILAFWLTSRTSVDPLDRPVKASYLNGFSGGVRVQITVASLGRMQLVTAPGEMCPEYLIGRRASVARYSHLGWPDYNFPAMPAIADYMTGRDKVVLGYANCYLGYLIPESDLVGLLETKHPNHYEELVTAGPHFGDSVGNKILQMLGTPVRFSNHPIHP